MDIRNNYLFGMDINLKKYGLGIISQPKLEDLLKHEIDYSDFIKIFYLSDIFSYKYKEEIKDLGMIVFLISVDIENTDEKLIDSLMKSLKILYKTENIEFIDHMASFIVNEDIVIDKDNFDTLCSIVLEMTKTKVNYETLDSKDNSEDELINEFERRKKEYEKRNSKAKNETTLLDIINTIIHYQQDIDYNKILKWTVYQIKNTFEVLVNKEYYNISLRRQMSMKFDIQEISDWKKKAKLDRTKFD